MRDTVEDCGNYADFLWLFIGWNNFPIEFPREDVFISGDPATIYAVL